MICVIHLIIYQYILFDHLVLYLTCKKHFLIICYGSVIFFTMSPFKQENEPINRPFYSVK